MAPDPKPDPADNVRSSTKKSPKNMYIPIQIQTNALNRNEVGINAAYISIEDLAGREKEREPRDDTRHLEIRYLESFKSIRDKIKSSYSCNQDRCPAIKERLKQHQLEHHAVPLAHCHSHHKRDTVGVKAPTHQDHSPVSISPMASILKGSTLKEQSIQTKPILSDLNHTTQRSINVIQNKSNGHTDPSRSNAKGTNDYKPLQNKISFSIRNCVLKNDLQDVVMTWFEDIPIYPYLCSPNKNIRKNLLNQLIDNIHTLTNEENNVKIYEKKIKKEIDIFLTTLPMWCPDSKRDQALLKEGIKNSLLTKIRNLRGKLLYDKPARIRVDDSVNTETSMSIMPFSQLESDKVGKLIESEILDWLMQIKFKESEDIGKINIIDTIDVFTRRLMPLLNRPACTRNYKLVLKGMILDTLNNLPNVLQFPKNERLYLNRIAEELTNRLLYIQVKCRNSNSCYRFSKKRNTYQMTVCSNSDIRLQRRRSVIEGPNGYLDSFHIYPRMRVIEDVIDILVDCIDSISYDDTCVWNEINGFLQTTSKTSENQSSILVSNGTIEIIRKVLAEDIINNANQTVTPSHSSTVSVYTSDLDLSGHLSYPVTSTPKQKPIEVEVMKQNSQEMAYTNKILGIIRTWFETLPKNFNEEKKFKETAIMDLASDIVDQMKLEQLVPSNDFDRNKIMTYIIFRWLYRFDIFEDCLTEDVPQILDLKKRINKFPVPNLTRPRHGNRQTIANTKMNESDRDFFIPKGTDVLEDEISIWMNEQPSDIYSKADRSQMVRDLAETLHNRLNKKRSETEIHKTISKWMKKNVKTSEKKSIDTLTENLKNRIINLPQDETLKENLHAKIREQLQNKAARLNSEQSPVSITPVPPDVDTDKTIKEFIAKYMEHNYDVADSVARGAFGELLKTEIRKLNPPTRLEVYENFTKPHDELSTDRLDKELQYIKLVSDWLRNIPIQSSFNTPHNKNRFDIVNDLSRNIYEVEEERRRAPAEMDYDMYLASIIRQTTKLLPILPEHSGNVKFMIDELIGKITDNRTLLPCCQSANQTAASINTSGIKKHDISEFINNYIHLNAGEFANDELDAWSARLIKEVKKIVQATAEPSTLCKAQVYNKLISVPIPEDESVKLFGLELDYAKEITDWLNNMPLTPLQNQEAINERVKMISELAEMFSERDRNRFINHSEPPNHMEIEEFITNWIKKIPLEPNKEIVIPILIQQLLKRIERVNKGKQETSTTPETSTNQTANTSKKSKSKSSQFQVKSPKCKPTCGTGKAIKPGQVVVDAIEIWSNNLPVQSDSKETEKTVKDDIARKLYQKVGELIVDPQITNDDLLFQEILADEVNVQLKNLPSNADIQKKKDLKNDLVDKIMEAKNIVQENVAGEHYKHRLENTIEASIPIPVTNMQCYDPGFEIYKNRLASMFILDNFDHGNDAVKIKYERKIRDEVDKYFQNAQKRNVFPLSKDEINNELYSALFKVPIPNEESVIKEVEQVKTRCEIDVWFDGLPIREALGLTELLEIDKILSMLAKRLHEIERNEQTPDEKMHKEIAKWVVRFPLVTGQDKNADKFADDLKNRLKTSKKDRKCVTSSSKSKEIKKEPNPKVSLGNKSQVAGPSSAGQMWTSNPAARPQTCCLPSPPRKKPAELILEIVEAWCGQIPLPAFTPQDQINNKITRDNLFTKIIIKICELNGNPQTFNDEILYEYLLDAELETLWFALPICCQIETTKQSMKSQLKEAVKSVFSLMREEKACYEYKQELKTTINNVLEEPLNTTADKEALFNQLKDEIVDNFVQYHYNRDDDEGKQIYKLNLHEIVLKFLQDIQEKSDDSTVNPLIRQNQLICELAKVPIPCERAINNEVHEIRMKEQVKKFFDVLALPDEAEDKMALRNNVKLSLAKRLNDVERTGHSCANDSKMKKDIMRCLKKIDVEVRPEIIDAFVNELKVNEPIRKAPPIENKAIVPAAPHKAPSTIANGGQVCNFNHFSGGTGRSMDGAPVENQSFVGVIPVTYQPAYPQAQLQNFQIPLAAAPLGFGPNGQFDSEEAQTHQSPVEPASHPSLRLDRDIRRGSYVKSEQCKCGRSKRKFKGRPRCVLRMEDNYDECDHFRPPMWMPMPCRMPPRYFYF